MTVIIIMVCLRMMVIVMIVIRISIMTVTVNDGDYYYGIDNEDNKNNDEVIGTLISTNDILVMMVLM